MTSWTSLQGKLWPPPRRDGVALGFGLAFVFFGIAGLARAAGAEIHATWFYPAIFIGLGVAGLVSLVYRRRADP
ncbi:MAG: hypothetical protein RL685_3253 [Pseudomonadota bacterium]|jgi:hypothetical protein